MKKFETPTIEVLELDVTDIITASTPTGPKDPNAGEEDIL